MMLDKTKIDVETLNTTELIMSEGGRNIIRWLYRELPEYVQKSLVWELMRELDHRDIEDKYYECDICRHREWQWNVYPNGLPEGWKTVSFDHGGTYGEISICSECIEKYNIEEIEEKHD